LKQSKLFEAVSPPKTRSRNKSFYELEPDLLVKKKLSDRQHEWLVSHDVTNWKEVEYYQEYLKPVKNGFVKTKIHWKLPGTQEPRDTCGEFFTKGCFNRNMHPGHKDFVMRGCKSCFRASCKKCWLLKWLSRESSRATERITKYSEFWKKMNQNHLFSQRKYLRPIHVIVSPPWKDKFISFEKLKEKTRKMLKIAGIEGGLMIYHPFPYDKKERKWSVRPHFHVIGFGWVVLQKKITNDGWVIKNKGVRNSLHSTIYYQLSHAGVSSDIHSLTWFGTLSYRAKFSFAYKIEKPEGSDFCEYCGFMLVECEFVGTDRPPDNEFYGLFEVGQWIALETVDEAVAKKEWRKNRKKNPRKFDRKDGLEGIGSIKQDRYERSCRTNATTDTTLPYSHSCMS